MRAPQPLRRLGFSCGMLGLVILACGTAPASAAQVALAPGAAEVTEAMQVVADVVLVESVCRRLSVDYGRLFAFADQNGIRPVDVMPLGERRGAFEAATRKRVKEMRPDRICSDLAADREGVIPGVFTAR